MHEAVSFRVRYRVNDSDDLDAPSVRVALYGHQSTVQKFFRQKVVAADLEIGESVNQPVKDVQIVRQEFQHGGTR